MSNDSLRSIVRTRRYTVGDTVILADTLLLTTDAESDAENITYTVDPNGDSDYPQHGLLMLGTVPLSDGSTFTGRVRVSFSIEWDMVLTAVILSGIIKHPGANVKRQTFGQLSPGR